MSIKLQIQENIKTAMKAKEQKTVDALRLVTASIKQKEVDSRTDMTDAEIITLLEKCIKQRKESIELYKKGNRDDLVEKEQFEIDVIQKYMPAAMSDEDVVKVIEKAIAEIGATSIKDMGKIMSLIKPQLAGKTDMSKVSLIIKDKL